MGVRRGSVNSTRESLNLHTMIDKSKNAMPPSRFQLQKNVEKKLAISNLDDHALNMKLNNQASMVQELTKKLSKPRVFSAMTKD